MKLRHVSDAAWVSAGQVATAIGTVVGIRLVTQFVEPATFGTVSLIVGIAALALNVGCTPVTQAALHLYPELAQRGETGVLRDSVYRSLRRTAPWFVAALAGGGMAWVLLGSGSPILVLLLGALVACDVWRAANHSILNAARLHRRYGLWLALEAWGRPLAATAAVMALGESAIAVLGAYVVASLSLNVLFRRNPAWSATTHNELRGQKEIETRMWRYALPLIPLGVIGWANGLSDRYIVGGLLGLADAGVYAAAYGLASRPLLIVNSALEQALRPLYQNAVSARQHESARRILMLWLAVMVAIGVVFVACLATWHREIASLLLGESFRAGSSLIPWIAAGYALLAVSYVFERVCYAHAFTQRVLLIQSLTAVAAAIATTFGALHWGLAGAAAAVPVYFSVQLVSAVVLARKTSQQVRLKEAFP